METYTLTILVALFLGVMGIIAILERQRRTELAQFEQLHQKLAQLTDALSQLRTAVEAGAKNSSDVTQSVSKEFLAEAQRTTKAVKDLQASMEASVNFTK